MKEEPISLRLKAQGLVAQIRARDRKGFALSFEAATKIVAEVLESFNREQAILLKEQTDQWVKELKDDLS